MKHPNGVFIPRNGTLKPGKFSSTKSAVGDGSSFKADNLRQEASSTTTGVISKMSTYPDFSTSVDFDHAEDGQNDESTDIDNFVVRSVDSSANVWDLTPYEDLLSDYPEAKTSPPEYPSTVNPSLFRNLQLNMKRGVIEVIPGFLYQVRAMDISNVTFAKSENGWVVLDPLRGLETAQAARKLFETYVLNGQEMKVTGVIYSHSHIDHFGGVGAFISSADKIGDDVDDSGNPTGLIPIYAPAGFTEHAVSENVIAGNVMARRSLYQYGNLLTVDEKGAVSIGLGVSVSTAVTTFFQPSTEISENTKVTIDGLDMLMQLTPGTEAPSEMNTFFTEDNKNVLWMAENTTNTFHNILTLRGAQVRDSLNWAKYIQQTIEKWGNIADVKLQSHHWHIKKTPGNDEIMDYLKKQRDLYKYVHDQSVRLMNEGYIGSEISEKIRLPPSLDKEWALRGYYGSLSHNSRAVYQYYMGWYTSNPSDLNNLPPIKCSPRYVEFMGGVDVVVEKAKDIINGSSPSVDDYRWCAEVLQHAVFTDKNHVEARLTLANVFEQLGYQAENGPWRNEYLTGAQESRADVPTDIDGLQSLLSVAMVDNMSTSNVLDYVSISLDAEKAYGSKINFQFDFTDAVNKDDETCYLMLENCVLNYSNDSTFGSTLFIDCHVTCNQLTFNRLLTGQITLSELGQKDNNDYFFSVDSKELHYLIDLFNFRVEFKVGFPIVSEPRDVVPMQFVPSHKKDMLKELVRIAPSMSAKPDYKQSKKLTKQLNGLKLNLGPGAC